MSSNCGVTQHATSPAHNKSRLANRAGMDQLTGQQLATNVLPLRELLLSPTNSNSGVLFFFSGLLFSLSFSSQKRLLWVLSHPRNQPRASLLFISLVKVQQSSRSTRESSYHAARRPRQSPQVSTSLSLSRAHCVPPC